MPDISLFVRPPGRKLDIFPTIRTLAEARTLRRVLRDCGVGVHNVEAFPIGPNTDVSTFEADLEKSAILGARRATTHIHDTDRNRALARFAELCTSARRYDIDISLEFMTFSVIDSFAEAVRFVRDSDITDATLVVDALHLHRTGGSPDLIDPENVGCIGSVQLCDAKLAAPREPFEEAIGSRMIPGEGELPLQRLLTAVPEGIEIDLEVPLGALRAEGVDALDRITRIVDAARRLISG